MKKVNVIANSPVHGVEITPMIGKFMNRQMTEDQIYRCLVGGAKVEEILPNGNTTLLNFTNYNKDNGGKLEFNPSTFTFTKQETVNAVIKQDNIKEESVNEEKVKEEVNIDEVVAEKSQKEEIKEEATTNEEELIVPEEQFKTAQEDTVKETVKEAKKEVAKPQININTNKRYHKK